MVPICTTTIVIIFQKLLSKILYEMSLFFKNLTYSFRKMQNKIRYKLFISQITRHETQ